MSVGVLRHNISCIGFLSTADCCGCTAFVVHRWLQQPWALTADFAVSLAAAGALTAAFAVSLVAAGALTAALAVSLAAAGALTAACAVSLAAAGH